MSLTIHLNIWNRRTFEFHLSLFNPNSSPAWVAGKKSRPVRFGMRWR